MAEKPLESISELKRGDIVRHRSGSGSFVIDAVGRDTARAVRTVEVSNPVEWILVYPERMAAEPAAPLKMTAEEIESATTKPGGFTRAQLAKWGVPWPPPRGWKRKLIAGEAI